MPSPPSQWQHTALTLYRDASTPTHDFLITPHPHCDSLYIATGGSFHSWKFLPVIGEYVTDMLDGALPAKYAERWHWDQPLNSKSANPTYSIVGDLQDIISGKMDPKAIPATAPTTAASRPSERAITPMINGLATGVAAH